MQIQGYRILETNIQGVSNLFDNLKTDSKKNREDISRIIERLGSTENDNLQPCNCEQSIQSLQDTVLDLKCRSMKNNLIFTGLHEVRDENTERLLRVFLQNEIGINYNIEFGNVHRFSYKPTGKRPIVARFLYHSDLQSVLDNAYKLKGKPYGIRQQFPREIEDRRKVLYPVQREAKRNGSRVVLVRDKLFIDNELYIPPASDETEPKEHYTATDAADTTASPKPNTSTERPNAKRRRVNSSTPTKSS